MAFGRPTKYKKEYCEKLIEHMSTGLSFEAFAGVIDVDVDTLNEWAKVHLDFSVAKRVAFEKCRLFWEKMGIEGSFHRDFKPAVWVYNMKCRFRKQWGDTYTIEERESREDDKIKRKYIFMEPKIDIDSDE